MGEREPQIDVQLMFWNNPSHSADLKHIQTLVVWNKANIWNSKACKHKKKRTNRRWTEGELHFRRFPEK